ncbi:MAG: DUF6282 family protein [Candidatus Bathyarchaeota archaeon]|nr:DUF6282 family protein [Candidatus Bathyarchaeota archaeon]
MSEIYKSELSDLTTDLLKGAIDVHVHVKPAPAMDRRLDCIEMAKQAREAGMKGFVLKDMHMLSTDKAYFVNKFVPGIKAWSGVVLDAQVGGLNPAAVESAIKLGASVVWMPVKFSRYFVEKCMKLTWGKRILTQRKERPISILEGGKLLPEAKEILQMISESKIVLGTGHISPEESFVLVDEAKALGINKIFSNHPYSATMGYTIEEMKELAKKGVYIEFCYATCMPLYGAFDPKTMVSLIKELGVEHCLMSSDSSQPENPMPVEMLRLFIRTMLALGMDKRKIELMVKKNPSQLLEA